MPRTLSTCPPLSCFVVLLALLMAGSSFAEPAAPNSTEHHHINFVPFTSNGVVPRTVFGVEMTAARPDRGLDNVAQLGPAWVRLNGLLWKDVEPLERRGYTWTSPTVAALEAELLAISARGLQPVLVVRGYPRWAAQTDCAPIDPDKYAQFASFLAAAVKRYSVPPFNVRYWELGNEPDAPIGADNMYGCWGNPADPYYGGRAYGNMLKAVYPAIKAANPQVQVLNGSLLLDRPTTPSAKFMGGVFAAGAANAFDVLGFHAYCMFDSAKPDGHDALYDRCADDWKVQFLRSMARTHGVPNKPLMRTETALLCLVGHHACRQQQANYVVRHYARSVRDRLLGSIWYIYDSDGFRNAALVEPESPSVPRPAWTAMQHAATMFGDARYYGELLGQPPEVEGHRFTRDSKVITVVWSNEAQRLQIPVAAGTTASCSGRDGQLLSCRSMGNMVELWVGPSPVYIVSHEL